MGTEKKEKNIRSVLEKIIGVSTGLLMAAVFFACGGGDGGGGTGSRGNTLDGQVNLSGSQARMADLRDSSTFYSKAIVQLLDSTGAVVAQTHTDDQGNFTFKNVSEGDYTLVLIDGETHEEVTRVSFSVADGDDVHIVGTVTESEAGWKIEFVANQALQNPAQDEKAAILAEASGLSINEIVEMRKSGKGWGEIANELGVHPGLLGLGHSDGFAGKKTTAVNPNSIGPSLMGPGKPAQGIGANDTDGPGK